MGPFRLSTYFVRGSRNVLVIFCIFVFLYFCPRDDGNEQGQGEWMGSGIGSGIVDVGGEEGRRARRGMFGNNGCWDARMVFGGREVVGWMDGCTDARAARC